MELNRAELNQIYYLLNENIKSDEIFLKDKNNKGYAREIIERDLKQSSRLLEKIEKELKK